jgi:para-aminobenzoate synthetase component 1
VTPLAAAARLHGRPGRVLLHSGRDDDGCGRLSFVASDPVATIEARGREVVVCEDGRVRWAGDADPFEALAREVSARDPGAGPGSVPIAIGYLGYDLGRVIEALPARAITDCSAPDMWFGIYGAVWRHDAAAGRAEIVGGDPAARARLAAALAAGDDQPREPPVFGALEPDRDRAGYERAVERLLAYIRAGDVYQVNLARRLRASVLGAGDALALYRAIVGASPSAYGALIETGGVTVVSGSPERFLSRRPGSDRVETRPIKGTRRRTGDPDRDRALARSLAADPKEQAEHLMIVDLERNDLGRVAVTGSVKVDRLGRVVELPTLLHMISTVSCRLRPEVGVAELLRATFPGGSITGAPKVRAMAIIDELEPTRRGVYTGALGFLGAGGAVDLAIAIRTAVICDGALHLHVGGGVVADSTAAREFDETEDKAAAWRAALDELATGSRSGR